MKKFLFMLLAAIWFSSGTVMAQATASGSITTSSTNCSIGAACLSIQPLASQGLSAGTVSVVVTGTWVGTLQFEASVDATTWVAITGEPLPSGAGVSSTTANGTWVFNIAAMNNFRVRASALSSGTASVSLKTSTAFARKSTFTNITVTNLEGVRYADQFPGADGCAKIQAAVNDVPDGGYVRVPLSISSGCAAAVTFPVNHIRIEGDSWFTALNCAAAAGCFDIEGGQAIDISYFKLSMLTATPLQAVKLGPGSDHNHIHNNIIATSGLRVGQAGIRFVDATNNGVLWNQIYNNSIGTVDIGVDANCSTNGTCNDNFIQYNEFRGTNTGVRLGSNTNGNTYGPNTYDGYLVTAVDDAGIGNSSQGGYAEADPTAGNYVLTFRSTSKGGWNTGMLFNGPVGLNQVSDSGTQNVWSRSVGQTDTGYNRTLNLPWLVTFGATATTNGLGVVGLELGNTANQQGLDFLKTASGVTSGAIASIRATLTNYGSNDKGALYFWTNNGSGAVQRASLDAEGLGLLNIGTGSFVGTALELPHVIKKAASANVRNSHDAVATSTSATYVKVKTITLSNGLVGIQRFLFDIKTGTAPTAAFGKIYRNGIALGTEQSDVTGGYITKSEDITQTWNPGDTCELWVHGNGTLTVSVQNFRIAYDDSATVAVASTNTTP